MNALIIIDMWDEFPKGYTRFQSIIEQTTNRLSKLISNWEGPVVLCCYQTFYNEEYDYWKKPEENEDRTWTSPTLHLLHALMHKNHREYDFEKKNTLISWNENEVISFLKDKNVSKLYFSGSSYPGCIEHRPLGMNKLKDLFDCILVVDCAINMFSDGFNEQEIIHDCYRYALREDNPFKIVTSDKFL